MKKTNLAFYLLPKSRWMIALFVAACSIFAVSDAQAQSVVLSEVEVANLIPQIQEEMGDLEASMKTIDPANKQQLNKVKALIAYYKDFVRKIKQQQPVDQDIVDHLFDGTIETMLDEADPKSLSKTTRPPKG